MRAEDETVAVIGAPISHKITFRATDLIACEICGGEEFDFGDYDCFVARRCGIWRMVLDLVGSYEEGVGRGVEDAGFMEVWSSIIFDQTLKGRVGPENGKKRVVIYKEWFGLRSCGRDDGSSEIKSTESTLEERAEGGMHTAIMLHSFY